MTNEIHRRFLAMRSLEFAGNGDMLIFAMNLACFGNQMEKVQGYYSIINNGHPDWVIKTEMVKKFIDEDAQLNNGNLAHAAKWYIKKRNEVIQRNAAQQGDAPEPASPAR